MEGRVRQVLEQIMNHLPEQDPGVPLSGDSAETGPASSNDAGVEERLLALLNELHPEDIAEFLEDLSNDQKHYVFSLLDAETAAAVLEQLDLPDQSVLLRDLDERKATEILEEMSSDDIADLIADLPQEQAVDILGLMQEEEAADVQELLAYLEDSAGGIMTTEFIALRERITVAEAIETLRRLAPDAETIYYLYVINDKEELVGVLSLRDLITGQPDTPISELMERKVISVRAQTDQEEVARVVAKYDLLALPVVDDENRLLGIVTVDDVIDVIEEEATEDIYRMAGTAVPEAEGLIDGILKRAKGRLPWLLGLLLGEMVAANVIEGFKETLQSVVVLAYFIPVLIGMGGNVGTQSLAIAVRGLATGELETRKLRSALARELKVGLVLGLGSGVAVFLVVMAWQRLPAIGLIVGVAMVLALVSAAFLGTLVPFVLHRFGVDPAVASGPFVTTLMDILGLLIYFVTATTVFVFVR